MPLSMASAGAVNTVIKVGGRGEVKRHLENLGFIPGSKVTVVSSTGGNVIVNVKDTRIAISKEMANKIIV